MQNIIRKSKLKIITSLSLIPVSIYAVESTEIISGLFTYSPALDIAIIAFGVTYITSLITKRMTPQDEIRTLKKDMKELQKVMKTHMEKKDMVEVKKIQKDIMKINGELFQKNMNLKNMLITTIPMLIIFSWIRTVYGDMGEFLNLGFTTFGWLGTYIWSSVICGIFWRKILKLA